MNGRAIVIDADRPGADKTYFMQLSVRGHQIEFGGGARRNAVAVGFGCHPQTATSPADGGAARQGWPLAISAALQGADTKESG